MIKIAINGFGRIGKAFLRVLLQDLKAKEKIKVCVINIGKGDIEAAAFAFKYDTLMGTYQGNVSFEQDKLIINNYEIDVIKELDPENVPWAKYEIDWVVDCTGFFTKRAGAEKHLKAGAKAVLISAPAEGEDVTIIPGVNFSDFDKTRDKIVSLGSCTTNALVPMIKVIKDNFEIKQAFMTTIHAYTNTQALLDVDTTVKDLRKGRAAALNIVPTTTGAMSVIDKIFKDLKGKISGSSLRVPVAKVSLVDLTILLDQETNTKNINNLFENASKTNLKNILKFTAEPLVSSDYSGDSSSVIIDSLLTDTQGNLVKIFGWYDNEWGYSSRLKDFLLDTLN